MKQKSIQHGFTSAGIGNRLGASRSDLQSTGFELGAAYKALMKAYIRSRARHSSEVSDGERKKKEAKDG